MVRHTSVAKNATIKTNTKTAKKKALITGITGQDGSFLAEFLLNKGYQVHGIVRRASTFNRERIDHLFGDPHTAPYDIHLYYGDLTDSSSIDHVMTLVKPDEVYHLGAQSHVGVSFDTPESTGNMTGLSTVRILEAIRKHCPHARYYQASSSEMFGQAAETPQTEATPFHPRSPYGCAKVYAYWTTVNYRESYGMFACNGVLYNHESSRRGENFVTRKITLSFARVLKGELDKLYLGNLEAKRDWGYAPDYVKGMWMMLQHSAPDDYILATNESHSVREFVEEIARLLGIDLIWKNKGVNEQGIDSRTGKVYVAIDPRYFRPAEVDALQGDYSKANKILGWKPHTTFKELAKIMITHDLTKLGITLPPSLA